MSVGNLKDSGNQGNNFPFQVKVLQGIQQIIDTGGGGGGGVQYEDGDVQPVTTAIGNQIMYNDDSGATDVERAVSISQPLPTTIAPILNITPTIVRTTGATPAIPTGVYSISIANVGSADGDVFGGTNNLKAGEVINIDAGAVNNKLGAITYDATGTEFLIVYTA